MNKRITVLLVLVIIVLLSGVIACKLGEGVVIKMPDGECGEKCNELGFQYIKFKLPTWGVGAECWCENKEGHSERIY